MRPIKVGGGWEDSLFVAIVEMQMFLESIHLPGADELKPEVNGRVDPQEPTRAPVRNSTIIYLNWFTKRLYPEHHDCLWVGTMFRPTCGIT